MPNTENHVIFAQAVRLLGGSHIASMYLGVAPRYVVMMYNGRRPIHHRHFKKLSIAMRGLVLCCCDVEAELAEIIDKAADNA
jgi:DNA-binding transcriptional regulator YdaS (Cro superfamily)